MNRATIRAGKASCFSELSLAVQSAARRQAVIHAHCPAATALAASGRALDQPFRPKRWCRGPTIPFIATDGTGNPQVAALSPLVPFHDVVLIAGNGVLGYGDSLERHLSRRAAPNTWVPDL